MTDGQTRGDTLSVERRSIDPIPDSERHGSVRNLFTVWFAANMQVTAVVTGALRVILGLLLPWAIVASGLYYALMWPVVRPSR